MQNIGTLDLETDPFKIGRMPRVFAGCFFDGSTSSLYWGKDCVRKMLRAMRGKFEGWKIFAHNGGKFDFHHMLEELVEIYGAENLDLMCIGSRIVRIRTPEYELRDSYALIPKPLRSFASKGDIEFEKLEENVRQKHKEEICRYLVRDCVCLHAALAQFFESYGDGITLASTTFKVLKQQFGIKPTNTGEDYDSKFRPYYFAGRVEFYALGKQEGNISIVDINSAFPWAMRFQHWFAGEYTQQSKPPRKWREQSFYHIIADSVGALPVRKKNGGVDFPTVKGGEFFATGWELFTGIELGRISNVKFLSCYVPTECADFSAYVNHFYELKKNAPNESERNFAKLFLNSLYGKFALNPRMFTNVAVSAFDDEPPPRIVKLKGGRKAKHGWELSFDDIDKGLSFWQQSAHIEDEEKPMRFYNVCTAASITGCVRAFLLRSMDKCKGVLYCDTDSIIAHDTTAIEIGDELGQWKLEKECDAVWIAGKKLYAAHDKRGKSAGKEWKKACKGVNLSPEDICAVAEGESRSCTFEAPNYSVFSAPRFTTRTVNRADKQKRK